MRFIKFPIVPILFGLIFGIIFEKIFGLKPNFISFLIISIAFLIVFIFNLKKKVQNIVFGILTVLLSAFFGQNISYLNNDFYTENHFSNYLYSERNITQGIVSEKLKSTKYYNKFIVKTSAINKQACKGKIIVYFPKKGSNNIAVGNKIKLTNTPKLLTQSFNPNQFDYTKYLNNQNVFFEIKLKENDFIDVKEEQNFYYYTNFVKQKLLKSYNLNCFSKDNYNLLMALLFGEKTELSSTISNSYTQAGIIHILAISGLHIALLFQIVAWLTKSLKKYKKGEIYIFIISMSILWSYAIIAGFSASIVRAVVMFSVIAVAKILNRQNNIYNSLALSALIILLFSPNYLFDIGFQLSYTAVLSIIVCQPLVRKYSYSKNIAILKTKELLIISLVAQIGVLPLTLLYFGQFPLLFLVANLFAIPLSSIILILGLISIPLNFLLPKIATYLNQIINRLIELMNVLTSYIVKFDYFIIKNIAFHNILVVLLYAVIGFVIYWLYFPKTKNIIGVLISIILFQLGFLFLNTKEKNNNEFVVFNVMKQSIFVETKNNKSVFYTNNFSNCKQVIDAYTRGKFVKNYKIEPFKNVYSFKNSILCIDSLGVYETKQKPEIVVLCQSPKINLKRLIDKVKPKQIIADGSNYKSYIKLWKATCVQEKIPFYATAEKGFFKLR